MTAKNDRLKGATLPPFEDWSVEGDRGLLKGPLFCLLLSRQPRRPGPGEWWTQSSMKCLRGFSSDGMAAVTGGGLLHLDFTRWAAHKYGPVIWVDAGDYMKNRPTGAGPAPARWFDLRLKPLMSRPAAKRDLMRARDEAVAAMADTLVAVAVREGGLMEKIGLKAIAEGKSVFALKPPKRTKAFKGNLNLLDRGAKMLKIADPPAVNKVENSLLSVIPGGKGQKPADLSDYLWHFTRERPGPWPGQSWNAYFNSLAASRPDSGHTALDTLTRILKEGRIRPSGRLIRGGHKVVCWTGANPRELLDKSGYRRGLVRWEFRPYAVGIKRDVAAKLGLKPAVFGDDSTCDKISRAERYLFQASAGGSSPWSEEDEWRCKGEFPLSALHPTEGAALAPSQAEAAALETISRFPIISMA